MYSNLCDDDDISNSCFLLFVFEDNNFHITMIRVHISFEARSHTFFLLLYSILLLFLILITFYGFSSSSHSLLVIPALISPFSCGSYAKTSLGLHFSTSWHIKTSLGLHFNTSWHIKTSLFLKVYVFMHELSSYRILQLVMIFVQTYFFKYKILMY